MLKLAWHSLQDPEVSDTKSGASEEHLSGDIKAVMENGNANGTANGKKKRTSKKRKDKQ